MRKRTFNVAKYGLMIPTPAVLQDEEGDAKEVLLASFAICTLTGNQELAALARAHSSSSPNSTLANEELLYEALVEVNGVPVTVPFYAFKKWETPPRDLVRLAFAKMNDLPRGTVADFLDREFPDPKPLQ